MRDLKVEPLWKSEDLGKPIPDVRHACSVCMPTWQSVIDYEEGRDRVIRALEAGYPRFFFHPDVAALFASARREYAASDQDVLIYPTRESAQRAQRFLELNDAKAIEIKNYKGVYILLFHKDNFTLAKLFWRYTGEGVSSRLAQHILENGDYLNKETNVQEEMAKVFGSSIENLHVWPSGMSAIYATHRFATADRSGKKSLQVDFPYVDSLRTQQSLGAGVVFLANCEGEDLQVALERIRANEFCAVYAEVPTNPLLKTPAIKELSKACQAGGTLFVIDDTVASHYNVDILQYADVVTSSCTKWISGQGDVMAGVTRINPDSPFAKQLQNFFGDENSTGSNLHWEDSEVLIKNSKGFEKRMKKVNLVGEAIADYLNSHQAIEQVYYPKYTNVDRYDSLKAEGGGYGGLISFVLKNEKKSAAVYDELQMTKGPSFGAEFSMASPYTMLAHYDELDWAEDHDVSRNLIRVSIGTESEEELIAIFDKALYHA